MFTIRPICSDAAWYPIIDTEWLMVQGALQVWLAAGGGMSRRLTRVERVVDLGRGGAGKSTLCWSLRVARRW